MGYVKYCDCIGVLAHLKVSHLKRKVNRSLCLRDYCMVFPYLKGFGFHEVKMNFYDFMVICL
jgi:hypothetical protein